jgi:hypothetical protein
MLMTRHGLEWRWMMMAMLLMTGADECTHLGPTGSSRRMIRLE